MIRKCGTPSLPAVRTASRVLAAPLVLAALFVTLSVAPRPAAADWPRFGRAITTAPNTQTHASIASDGAGGAIITWQDSRSPRVNIFAQHVLASGEVDSGWPVDGRALLTDSLGMANAAGGQFFPVIVPDGSGGAIVAWQDDRSAVTGTDVFAQHVLASGVVDPAWPANGLAVGVDKNVQNGLAMVPDGAGGAIVTWVDRQGGIDELDIVAQHVLGSGVADPAWPEGGAAVCFAPGPQSFPVMLEDGAGGAIIAWQDLRDTTTSFDVYALHVLSSGVRDLGWPEDGRAVCNAAGAQGRPTITTDGANGAIVAWTDARTLNENHIFAQHVFASGTLDRTWPVNGLAISDAAVIETRPLAVSDGAGGAIVNWQGFTVHLNMYAQHVLATGVVDPAWPTGGLALTDTDRTQTGAEIVPDGAGGAVVVWQDSTQLISQHILASGVFDVAYPDTGRVVSGVPTKQGDAALLATGGGGAIAAWTDGRNGPGADIFAMQLLEVTTLDVPGSTPPGFTFAGPSPNPARGPLTMRFVLPRAASVRLAVFDLTGRRVRELVSGTTPAGEHAIHWDLRDESGQAVVAGVYFARLDVGQRTLTQKLIHLR